jgi:hypothetical protein
MKSTTTDFVLAQGTHQVVSSSDAISNSRSKYRQIGISKSQFSPFFKSVIDQSNDFFIILSLVRIRTTTTRVCEGEVGEGGEYDKIDKRVQNEAIISLVHGNTNNFKEVYPHGYVSKSTND